MRKLLIGTASAALLGGFAGIAPAGAQELTFALVPKNMNNPFFDQARDGCMKAEGESGGKFKCEYIGPGEHGGGEEQVQVVLDLIAKGVDGIAVSPSNAAAMGKALEKAKEANIPVLTWDSDLLEKDKGLRIAYVGTKNYDIGVNLAKLAQEIKPQGGTICIQSGGAAAANHNERMQGIRDTLSGVASAASPGDQLTGQNGWTEIEGCPVFTNDQIDLANQQMADVFTANPDLGAFILVGGWAQFGPQAYAQVTDQVKAKLQSKELIIVAGDTLPPQIDALKAGRSHAQVGQRPFEMGYKAPFVMRDLVEGKTVEPVLYTGLDECTQENVDTCIAK